MTTILRLSVIIVCAIVGGVLAWYAGFSPLWRFASPLLNYGLPSHYAGLTPQGDLMMHSFRSGILAGVSMTLSVIAWVLIGIRLSKRMIRKGKALPSSA